MGRLGCRCSSPAVRFFYFCNTVKTPPNMGLTGDDNHGPIPGMTTALTVLALAVVEEPPARNWLTKDAWSTAVSGHEDDAHPNKRDASQAFSLAPTTCRWTAASHLSSLLRISPLTLDRFERDR